MISDIETILAGFTGTWKPGIEEQSIRMAHAVALQGDTATASNILRFIAIPEPMKLQILGASLQAKPVASAANPISQSAAPVSVNSYLPAKTMPEPLLFESSMGTAQPMTIPVVSESDVAAASEPAPVVTLPAFSTDLSTQETLMSDAQPGVIVPSTVTEQRVLPSTPVGSLPFERQQLFDKAFASVQSQAAMDTSRPMVKDADNITVIHTYAEPEQSTREVAQIQAVQNQKGFKLFQSLEGLLRRTLIVSDSGLRTAAVAQWDRLNTEFPDYKTFHHMDWSAMEGMINQLKDPTAVPMSKPVDTTPTATTAESPEASPVDMVPITTATTGGYFAHPVVDSQTVAPIMTTPDAPPAAAPVSGVGGYFAHKAATQPVGVEHTEAPLTNVSTLPTQEIESITLPSGLGIKKNMTITGDSIYRVQAIHQSEDVSTVVFTDEIHTYIVPIDRLSDALENSDTQPDTFFAQYMQ